VAADPEAWLGAEHVGRYGSDTGLLVKLLDAGQRLPVHVHPDRRFAAEHLARPHGKTESWIVVEAEPDAAVYVGFNRDVGADELIGWARSQDVEAMLAATNRVPVVAGDSVLCPAGTPHAISAGILVIELQEPADLSIMMEWASFGLAEQEATLGLPLEEALACVNRRALPPERLDALRGRPLNSADLIGAAGSLLPAEGDPFFVAERVDARVSQHLSQSYGVLVVTAGEGRLDTENGGSVPVRRGSTVLIPHAAGPAVLTGTVEGVRCLPAALPLTRRDLTGPAGDEAGEEDDLARGRHVAGDPGEQQLRGGRPDGRRVLGDHGQRRGELVGQRELVEADQRDPARAVAPVVLQPVQDAHRDQVVAGEDRGGRLRQADQRGRRLGRLGPGAQPVPDEGGFRGQPVLRHRLDEAAVPLPHRPDVLAVAQVADAAVAVPDQVPDRRIRAVPVVHQHGVDLQVGGRPVHADDLDAEILLRAQEPVAAGRRDKDYPVHPPRGERGDDLALAGQAVVRTADEHHAGMQPGGVLHGAGQRGEERVGDVVHQQADRLGRLGMAAELAGGVVAVVPELPDRAFDLSRGLRLHAGLPVDHARDGHQADARDPGDVSHGRSPGHHGLPFYVNVISESRIKTSYQIPFI
jgi:mannose-6-phosphate isomerase